MDEVDVVREELPQVARAVLPEPVPEVDAGRVVRIGQGGAEPEVVIEGRRHRFVGHLQNRSLRHAARHADG